MKSWTGEGAAMRVHSPDFDKDFSELPQIIQSAILIGCRLSYLTTNGAIA